jgi:hypothetical protein
VEIEGDEVGSGEWADDNVAVINFCEAHFCGDHGGAFAVNVSTGREAGALHSQ